MKLSFSTKKLNYAWNINKQNWKLSRSSRIFSRPASVQTSALTIHSTTIQSCGRIYEKWQKIGKFARVPNSDLTFQVKHLDTFESLEIPMKDKAQVPVVVALHGAPGSCCDFSILAEFLSNKGVRFIAPTLPDFSTFRPDIFRHTPEERAQYVTDFLSAISVPKADLLVCHSSATYPGLLLCLDQNPRFKALAMLNPTTFSMKMPAIKNYGYLKLMVKASENSIYLKMMKAICPLVLKLARVPVRVDNFLDPLLSSTVMVRTNIPKTKEKFHQLASEGFPIFFAFGEDDKLIGKENSLELADLLGVKSSDICFINKDGTIERKGNETPKLKVMAFENGSHYVFWKHSDIINKEVYRFLQKVSDNGHG